MMLRKRSRVNKYATWAALALCGFASHLQPVAAAEVAVSGSPAKERIFAGAYQSLRLGRVDVDVRWFHGPQWRQRMTNLLKRYGFRVFRLHFPPYQHWKSPVAEWGPLAPLWGGTVKDVLGDEEFLAWLKENDFKGILQVNVDNFYDPVRKAIFELREHPEYVDAAAAEQADLVALAKRRGYADRIYYWELGNEDYHTTPPEFFADVCARFMRAMKKADPAIRLGVVAQAPDIDYRPPKLEGRVGPFMGLTAVNHRPPYMEWNVGDAAQQPGWTTRFLTEVKRLGIPADWVDFAVHHAYADEPPEVALGTRKSPTDIPPLEADWARYQRPFKSGCGSLGALAALLDRLGYARARIEVNEFRRGGYNSYYSRSFMNALANADAWMSLLRHPRVSGALIWDSFNASDFGEDGTGAWKRHQGYGIFMRVGDRFLASPVAEMYKLFDRLLADGDDVLKCRADSVDAVATRGSRGVKMLVLNKGDECDAGIRFEGVALPPHGRAAVCELQCDDLGAFTVHPSTGEIRSFAVFDRPPAALAGNQLTYRLRRHSLTLFEVSP